jgi:hypothetical protein
LQAFQPIVVPFTTAFYNLGAMFGVYPPLEVVETKKVQHHLRYMDAGANNAEAGMANEAVKTPQDIVQERRRAKAMKVSSCIIECCGGVGVFYEFYDE